jgi:hypothetical protein
LEIIFYPFNCVEVRESRVSADQNSAPVSVRPLRLRQLTILPWHIHGPEKAHPENEKEQIARRFSVLAQA